MSVSYDLNKLIDDIVNSEKRLIGLSNETDNITEYKINMEKNIRNKIFQYDIIEIIELLDISIIPKIALKTNISNVNIYWIQQNIGLFTVKYNYNNPSNDNDDIIKFEIKTNSKDWEPKLNILKNDIQFKILDLNKEYKAFDFTRIDEKNFLDNYIKIITNDDKSIRLGMLLVSYFYLLEYYKYMVNDFYIKFVTSKSNIQKLDSIFRMDYHTFYYKKK